MYHEPGVSCGARKERIVQKKKKSESIWNDTGASLEILPMPKIQTIEQ